MKIIITSILFLFSLILYSEEKIAVLNSFGSFSFGLVMVDQHELLARFGGYMEEDIEIIKDYNYQSMGGINLTFTVIANDNILCGIYATSYNRSGKFFKIVNDDKWETLQGLKLGDRRTKAIKIYGEPYRIEVKEEVNFDKKFIYKNEKDLNLISELEFSGDTLVGINIWYGP